MDCVDKQKPRMRGAGASLCSLHRPKRGGTRYLAGRVGLSKFQNSPDNLLPSKKPDGHVSVGLLSAWGLIAGQAGFVQQRYNTQRNWVFLCAGASAGVPIIG